MTAAISVAGLSRGYRGQLALDRVAGLGGHGRPAGRGRPRPGPLATAEPSAAVPAATGRLRGGAASVTFVFFLIMGFYSLGRTMPFGLSLGFSRRSYYLGTALLAVVLAATDGLAITLLQAIERGSGGWGIALHFFRVPYILDGPWYLTWLTSFAGLSLLFGYGMWLGLVQRRWGLAGSLSFLAAQVTVVVAVVLLVTVAHAWSQTGHFFTTLSAARLTGLLAILAAVLLAGGYATVRRVVI